MSVNTTAAAASSSTPCRVAVAGASGRMGRMLIEAIRASDDCVLAGALEFSDLVAADVIVPLDDLVCVPAGSTPAEVERIVALADEPAE